MWTQRTELLLGKENLEHLKSAHVLIAGLGGVGAYVAEMLCRAGIGTLTIVDADDINETNINRQLLALTNTVGKAKIELMKERLLLINPDVKINAHKVYLCDELAPDLITTCKYDYVVDAIDTLAPKVWFIKTCMDAGLPLVSSMGAGAKLAPEEVKIADISKSRECPLAYMLRKRLRKVGISKGFKVVFSTEKPIKSAVVECDNEQNKKSVLGTISYLPAVFGCFCASVVIRDIIEKYQDSNTKTN